MSNAIRKDNQRDVEAAFEASGNPIKNGKARCLLHDDKTPSMSVKVVEERLVVHCHAGCPNDELFEEARKLVSNYRGESTSRAGIGRVVSFPDPSNANRKAIREAWSSFPEAVGQGDGYCKQKGVQRYGLKVNERGEDVVPMLSDGGIGEVVGYQSLGIGAEKKNAPGSAKKGSAYIIGRDGLTEGARVIVCEGYATAATVYEATGIPAACAFGAGNALLVLETLRGRGYEAVCGCDDDGKGREAEEKARQLGFRGVRPSFDSTPSREKDHDDWNDLATLSGIEAVREQIEEQLSAPFEPLPMEDATRKSKGKNKKAVYADYQELVRQRFPQKPPRKDLISGRLCVFDRGQWLPIASEGSGPLAVVQSAVCDSGGFYSLTPLTKHLKAWEHSSEGELLLDVAPWDGEERLKALTDCLNAEVFEKAEVYELLAHWLITALRKARDPKGKDSQNMVLVLQGAQGIGKDRFIDVLLNIFRGPANYVATLLIKPNTSERDWGEVLSSNILVSIPEFDRLQSQAISTFKHLVTATEATWDRKYEADPVTKSVRASIVASINPKEVASDPTGARRYLLIELKGKPASKCGKEEAPAIRWGYDDVSDPVQLLAEVVEKEKSWSGLSRSTIQKLEEVQQRMTPSDEVEDAIREFFDLVRSSPAWSLNSATRRKEVKGDTCMFIPTPEAKGALNDAAFKYGISASTLRARLGVEGYLEKDSIRYAPGSRTSRGCYVPIDLLGEGAGYSDVPQDPQDLAITTAFENEFVWAPTTPRRRTGWDEED
jgi:hypothetical protein